MSSLILLQNVQPKASTTQESAPPTQPPGGGLFTLLPLVMFVPLLFVMFRRQKKEQEQRAKLKKGDWIVSQSGLIGELVEMDEKISKVKIAPGTTVQMTTGSLSPLSSEAEKKSTSVPAESKEGAVSEKKS